MDERAIQENLERVGATRIGRQREHVPSPLADAAWGNRRRFVWGSVCARWGRSVGGRLRRSLAARRVDQPSSCRGGLLEDVHRLPGVGGGGHLYDMRCGTGRTLVYEESYLCEVYRGREAEIEVRRGEASRVPGGHLISVRGEVGGGVRL